MGRMRRKCIAPATSRACFSFVRIICLCRVRIELDDRPCSAVVAVGEDASGARWYIVKRHAGLASGYAIGRQQRRRRKSAKVELPTGNRGKTIHDGSSNSTLSTPFSFGNCLMPAVELDAGRLVGGSEADRSRVLERMHEYLEANASFDWGQLQDIWSGAPEAVFFNLNGHTYKGREQWTPRRHDRRRPRARRRARGLGGNQ